MTPSNPDASQKGSPSPSAILLVFLVYVAGTTCNWGFLSWWSLLLVLGAAFLAFWFHARPDWRGPPPEAMLLGIFIGCVAANCLLQPGPNEYRLEETNLTFLQRFAAQHLTAPGVAIQLLAAVALLLAVSYFRPSRSAPGHKYSHISQAPPGARAGGLRGPAWAPAGVTAESRDERDAAPQGCPRDEQERSLARPYGSAPGRTGNNTSPNSRPGALRFRFAALILIAVALRVLILFATPLPAMDVFVVQTEGGRGLIEGKHYRLDRVAPVLGHSSEEVARYAASVETRSRGPFAAAIVGYALRQRIGLYDSSGFASCPGKCDRAIVAGKEVLVGSTIELNQEGEPIMPLVDAAAEWRAVAADREVLGSLRLVETSNVYEMTFAAPDKDAAWFYNDPYPPLVVYCNCISWLLFRDVRGAWIICDLLAAWLLYLLARRSNPGPKGTRLCEMLALTFLFLPRSLFVIEQSWTEPLMVVSLAAFALAAASGRGPALTGCLLGLWLSSKQYAVLTVPPILKWLRPRLRICLFAAGFALALALPFILWNFTALMHDAVWFLLESAGRPDALSLCGLAVAAGIPLPPEVTGLIVPCLWIAGIAWFTWKMPRNLSGMLFASAGLWIFFFVLCKQAFTNYFYMVSFTLLLAVAASTPPGSARS